MSIPRQTEPTIAFVACSCCYILSQTVAHLPSMEILQTSSRRDDSGGFGVISQCSQPYLTSLGRIVPWGMADRVKERDCIDDWNTKTKGDGNTGVSKPPALASPRFGCEQSILRFHEWKFGSLSCLLFLSPFNLRSKTFKMIVTNLIGC
jgi:hypothetical protein